MSFPSTIYLNIIMKHEHEMTDLGRRRSEGDLAHYTAHDFLGDDPDAPHAAPHSPGLSTPPPPAYVEREQDDVAQLRARIRSAVDADARATAEASLARAKGKSRAAARLSACSLARLNPFATPVPDEAAASKHDQEKLERARRALNERQQQSNAARKAQPEEPKEPRKPKPASADGAAKADVERQPAEPARRRSKQGRACRCVCGLVIVVFALALLSPLLYYGTLAVMASGGNRKAERLLWDFQHFGGGDGYAAPPAEAGRGQWRSS